MNNSKNSINFNDAINFANSNYYIAKRRKNRILLSDFQIDILKSNGIDYQKYANIHDIMFDIEDILNTDYNEELDLVSSQLAEIIYYSETKK